MKFKTKCKKLLVLILILALASCSSSRGVFRKNQKAVNRVIGNNLVNEVINKSGWLEYHPMDTTIIAVSYEKDTVGYARISRIAVEEERRRLFESLKGRCLNRDIQGVIDSIANTLQYRDTVFITTKERYTVQNNRALSALKDSFNNKLILIAELTGRIYENKFIISEFEVKLKEQKRDSKKKGALLIIIPFIILAYLIYNKFKKVNK